LFVFANRRRYLQGTGFGPAPAPPGHINVRGDAGASGDDTPSGSACKHAPPSSSQSTPSGRIFTQLSHELYPGAAAAAAPPRFSLPCSAPMHAVHYSPTVHAPPEAFGSVMRAESNASYGQQSASHAAQHAPARGEATQGASQQQQHQYMASAADFATASPDDPLMTHVAGAHESSMFMPNASHPVMGASSCRNTHAAGANAVQRDVIGQQRGPVASPNVNAQPFDISRHNVYASAGQDFPPLMSPSDGAGSFGVMSQAGAGFGAAGAEGEHQDVTAGVHSGYVSSCIDFRLLSWMARRMLSSLICFQRVMHSKSSELER
jgi:hypothetical protein